jgi:hypothetical protein
MSTTNYKLRLYGLYSAGVQDDRGKRVALALTDVADWPCCRQRRALHAQRRRSPTGGFVPHGSLQPHGAFPSFRLACLY